MLQTWLTFHPRDPDAAKLEPVRSAGSGSRGAMNRSRSAVTRIKGLYRRNEENNENVILMR